MMKAVAHSRGLFILASAILGFRFAPPQALCWRRAPRARNPIL